MYPVELRGETIEIREIETGDVAAIARVIGAPNVLRYTTWKGPADEEAAANYVSRAKDTAVAISRDNYLLAIVDIESGEVAGAGGLRIEDRDAGVGSLRCLLHPDWWNRGIGTEAAGLAVDFGFEVLGLQRIEADPAVENTRSTSLLARVGLTRGEVRPGHDLAPDGQRRDSVVYEITREEWGLAR